MKIQAFLALLLCVAQAHASCHKHPFTDPLQVSLDSNTVLIVTHASPVYDPQYSTKRGVDEATSFAKSKGIPTVYLKDSYSGDEYFTADCSPDYWVQSENGELSFQVPSSRVLVAGGHLEQCLFHTVNDVLASWAEQPKRNLTMTFLMDAIYSSGDLVKDSDAYAGNFSLYMRAMTYRHAEDEPWPKVSLLQTLGMINNEDSELEFLTRTLPNFNEVLPADYRVELQLNDSTVRVLKQAQGKDAPTLRFQFVDSASRAGTI